MRKKKNVESLIKVEYDLVSYRKAKFSAFLYVKRLKINDYIRITCPCNEHPLTPHFYIEKVGCTRVYIFFLFLLENIDCGYSLEPVRRF